MTIRRLIALGPIVYLILLIVCFQLIFALIIRSFHFFSLESYGFIFTLLVGAILGFITYIVSVRVLKLTSSKFLRRIFPFLQFSNSEIVKYLSILDQFKNDLIATNLTGLVCEKILKFIQTIIPTKKVIVFFWKEEMGKFAPFPDSGEIQFFIFDPFLLWITENDRIYNFKEFATDPSLSKIRNSAENFFTKTEAELVVPLILNKSLLGIIVLGERQNRKNYTLSEINKLNEIRSVSVMALSNAIFYERLIELTETLEEKVKIRTQELEETQSQLIMSEKMASLGIMVAGIAHEINTPAGVINGAADNLDQNMNYLVQNVFDVVLFARYRKLRKNFELALLHLLRDKKKSELDSKEKFRLKNQLKEEMKSMNFSPTLTSELSNFIIENQIGKERKYIYNIILKDDDRGYFMLKNAAYINRNIKNIRYAIRNIVRIVKALKSYSHLDQSKTFSSSNIIEGMETTLIILNNQIKYGIDVIKNFQEIPLVICNPDELNQVWTNLIQNSIQALKGKGKIEISVFPWNGYVVVEIEDNGPGIPAKIQDRIWDPFFTTKDQGEGTGLGLGIVKGIVEKHKGKITLNSNPGKTVFRVELPINPENNIVKVETRNKKL
ncbi:ATP-binding protein [Leptospira interrogans]|uniref:histidine kinase n=19 Tax=Leptospira interrogans TaxID=173 RepID=A0A0E2D375_LEPIR|nr:MULTISPECIES: ATP-binding protein [Leptospira]OCA00578.1 Histidine kinase sensor protein [Leptospira interrogans serovar Copenhageni/Icterohaemorrhagiae]AAS68753.1 histidine kinase sensor protein [Leptospira interrogans serovar Copenhageni str. Fiocruz L1-130]AJR12723.1 two component system sensor histidine kinase [Leptospira interrogans serovar Linhai str. 56609]ALN98857.1 histidine kinase [Leptospira interrogans serovar Hardjo-prajitno]EKR47137.1 GHKL domain protein [Leptospira interrogan